MTRVKPGPNHPWRKFKYGKNAGGATKDQVFDRCSVCDYSPSTSDGMHYHTGQEHMSQKHRQMRKVYIDHRDGRPVCNVCRKVSSDAVMEYPDLNKAADDFLKLHEEELLTDEEILEGLEE